MANNGVRQESSVVVNDGILTISGALTFATATNVFLQSRNFLLKNKVNKIDLSCVNVADSAAVGFLIEIIIFMKKQNSKFVFCNISTVLKSIIKVFAVDELITKFT